jgi:hypothetical protein
MTVKPLTPHIIRLARDYAADHASDPFAYARAICQLRNGIATIGDDGKIALC